MKFKKKPVVIEAWHFDGRLDTSKTLPDEIKKDVLHFRLVQDGTLQIQTLEGPIYASVGDWIIKGVKGEFYPCKPDIFAATYEPAD